MFFIKTSLPFTGTQIFLSDCYLQLDPKHFTADCQHQCFVTLYTYKYVEDNHHLFKSLKEKLGVGGSS